MARSFHISASQRHLKWSQSVPPVLTVPSGAEVEFDLLDGGHNQVRPDNAATALAEFDFAMADPAMGPVFIEGAEPGDVLRIDVLDLAPGPYGWTAIFPGFGLLSDEFTEPRLKMWDLSSGGDKGDGRGRRAVFKPGISVPVRPFLGLIGVAPAVPGELSTIPPYAASGGNVDCRDLATPGGALFLPVNVPGALLSCGDGHAAQGDGEVCGTAIETPMRARLRLTVEKRGAQGGISCPHYLTPPAPSGSAAAAAATDAGRAGEYAALGIHENPKEAARMALRGLIDWLAAEKGLTRVEAYMLSSVAASLRMSQVVDMPNYSVSCAIPLSVFED